MCFWGESREVPGIHGYRERDRGQPSQSRGHLKIDLSKEHKEIHALNGRVTAFSRFMSRAAHKEFAFLIDIKTKQKI